MDAADLNETSCSPDLPPKRRQSFLFSILIPLFSISESSLPANPAGRPNNKSRSSFQYNGKSKIKGFMFFSMNKGGLDRKY